MEFCSIRELINQTGHGLEYWPCVLVKQLLTAALDAAGGPEGAAAIWVAVKRGLIVVHDSGPGIKTATIKSVLDYTIRVSSREAYVSPTRGAQGNALKTI